MNDEDEDDDDGFGDFQEAEGAEGGEAYAQIGSEESDDYDEEGYGALDLEPMANFEDR